MARITGGGLVQVVVTNLEPLAFNMFLNSTPVEQQSIESFALEVLIPSKDDEAPVVRAILTRYVVSVSGSRTEDPRDLFPCTFELVANDRRICVSCPTAGSLDGLWMNVGLDSMGAGREVTGARGLQIVLADSILSATLVWMDDTKEDLLKGVQGNSEV